MLPPNFSRKVPKGTFPTASLDYLKGGLMAKILTIEETIQAIKSAFEPLVCKCEVSDYGNSLGFCVYEASGGERLLCVLDLKYSQFSDTSRLRDILLESRSNLISRGVIL